MTRQQVLRRILRGADPRMLGRRGGLKAAANRRKEARQKDAEERGRNMWYNNY
jgi:hypothetical protein